MKRLVALLAFVILIRPALADGLPPNVLGALKAAQIPANNVAVVVQPVDAGKPADEPRLGDEAGHHLRRP